jgi:hypothetical protein
VVLIKGFSKAELNGRVGMVLSYDAGTGRCAVRLSEFDTARPGMTRAASPDTVLGIKPTNLEKHPDAKVNAICDGFSPLLDARRSGAVGDAASAAAAAKSMAGLYVDKPELREEMAGLSAGMLTVMEQAGVDLDDKGEVAEFFQHILSDGGGEYKPGMLIMLRAIGSSLKTHGARAPAATIAQGAWAAMDHVNVENDALRVLRAGGNGLIYWVHGGVVQVLNAVDPSRLKGRLVSTLERS